MPAIPLAPFRSSVCVAACRALGGAMTAMGLFPAPDAIAAESARQDVERPKRSYVATRIIAEPPAIDGRLDEPCWTTLGEWSGNYTQQEPDEGVPASQPTELKILYDDRHLYVAIRAFDAEFHRVQHLRGQRDEFTGDMVGITFDSYHDRRTAFEFNVTSGGSKIDLQIRDQEVDLSWNAVWDVRVAHDESGWTAEYRIPFNQLRYARQQDQLWGLHSWRWIKRRQEESDWNPIPMDNSGMVYEFGELRGIRELPHTPRIELLPYAVVQHNRQPREAGNPYRRGGDTSVDAGLDAKIGVASDFTLDLTINPDFGQVELDPSEINLTTYETFFEERRPFFIEGKDVLTWSLGDDQLFYSRRIGDAPSLRPAGSGFLDVPAVTRIDAAAKLTGKTRHGLAAGGLYARTPRTMARVTLPGSPEARELAEPATDYFVGRLQQEIVRGHTTVGGMATATVRTFDADEPAASVLTRRAYTGGLDFRHLWDDRRYEFLAEMFGSRAEGSSAALERLMRSPVHNFQRPDADHVDVRTDARSLSGHGGRVRLGRIGGGRWRYYGNYGWRSPGLELNDLGFLTEADRQRFTAGIDYVVTRPGPVVRNWDAHLAQYEIYDFGGTHLNSTTELWSEIRLNSDWTFEPWIAVDRGTRDTHMLRGGPSFEVPSEVEVGFRVKSPGTASWHWFVEAEQGRLAEGGSRETDLEAGIMWRAFGMLSVQPEVSYESVRADHQYVGTAVTSPGGATRYLLGRMEQRTLGTTIRIDANFTPTLSLSWYGSLFSSSGDFAQFKRVTDPLAPQYRDRFASLDGSLSVDPTGNTIVVTEGPESYAFAHPDFDLRELKSNLVLRWEYRAGSTIYLVWTQGRADRERIAGFSAGSDYRRLLRAPAENIFLIKASHWFSP